jgi:2-oxoglutarate ferredoxin oxidoreductase subunit alpha
LYVFGNREYYSNIKGEHSYFRVRVSKQIVRSHLDTVDLLATFDDETIARHAWEVRKDGAIIYDPALDANQIKNIPTLEKEVRSSLYGELSKNGLGTSIKDVLEVARRKGVHVYAIPYTDLLKTVGEKFGETSLSNLTRMVNVLAVAASFALVDYDEELIKDAIRKQFKSKPKAAEMNAAAVAAAYLYVREKYNGSFEHKLAPAKTNEKRIFIRGNNAVAIAKLLAGCRLQTYYPITPASDESEYLEAHEVVDLDGSSSANNPELAEAQNLQGKGTIAVIQAEDEIAAVTMAIGGALAGTRSSTSTSGPGFSLMAEGMGWGGMMEVPVVITLYSRGGPSTGLPTRHEQGDLRFAIHAGHGEFPRIVYASGDLEEVFYDTLRVFNYAERYQTPVIQLIDKAMANSDHTIPYYDPNRVKIERGLTLRGAIEVGNSGEFERFKQTETGVSPRPVLGTKGGIYWNTGDEHDSLGHISEDPTNRSMMMEKRMRKLELAAKEIPLEEKVNFFGPENAPITVVSWGSTKGAIIDAMEKLKDDGIAVNFLQIKLLNPLPSDYVREVLLKAKLIVDIESNFSGQLGGLIREKTLIPVEQYVLKYNGRPMSCEEIYFAIKEISSGKAPKRVILTNGA